MSAMQATEHHSTACCNVPPIVVDDYQSKGSYETVDNLKTYVTGPSDAKKGILVVYDIFGYYPQTIQGADILALSNDDQNYRVLMPDWFEGKPSPIEWFPPDTDDKKEKLNNFFVQWPPSKIADRLPAYMEKARAQFPETTEWAILGYCWGGKVMNLVASNKALFKVGAACHPAMTDEADAPKIAIPVILLASGDEDADDVAKWEKALQVPHHVETFDDQVHGWMAARSDLKDERVREEYVRGYKLLLKFFGEHL